MKRERHAPAIPAPRGIRGRTFRHAGDEYLVLSHPIPRAALPPELTAAEADVARAILTGETHEQISRRRGTSKRTVANQVASIFRKATVGSLAELAALVHRTRHEET